MWERSISKSKFNQMGVGIWVTNTFKVRFVGPEMMEIQRGRVYDAIELENAPNWYGVKDDSGEWYAYAKKFFEIVNGKSNN